MSSAALSPTQDNRQFSVTSPLGKDVLLFRSMTSSEELGRLFTIKLELLSTEENICVDDILGQSMTVHIDAGDETRYLNGIVSSFTHLGALGSYTRYGVILRPWLWLLTRTSDCRVFPDNTKSQELTIPEIIKGLFSEHGFPDVADELNGEYAKVGYCVQYRETDFNFVSRLMEQEGIYYFFRHEEDKHTLVLSDSPSSHAAISGWEEVPYYPPADSAARERDHISEWLTKCEVQTGTYALNDFDFENPRADLKTKQNVSRGHCQAEFELYDYPGGYLVTDDGEICARRRIEELQVNNEVHQGSGNVRGLFAGGLFNMVKFPRDDQNREYLVTSTRLAAQSNAYESAGTAVKESFHCSFTTLDGQGQFRPRRITPKPVVQGPQTAVVVGKAGEEIWTDKHGRAKVQFHWDRYGNKDENSSCWVRISQAWAGKGWGGILLPRIGQEVIVEFLEGDPDQPIITGRVYNGDNKVPWDLPANQTQSGLLSRSTKEGSSENFNQLRFEDKKGEEQVYLHAEKDEKIEVENDKTESVGNNETITIGNDRTETVGNDETVTVNNNRTETVMANETLTVQKDRTRNVNKNETVTVALSRTRNVGINEAVTVGVAQEVTVGGFRALTVGAYQNTEIALNHSENIGNNYSLEVGDSRDADIGDEDNLKVGKKLTVDAGDEILIKTGKASIVMKKDGSITIKGKDIVIEGSGAINVKASKDVVLKGSKVLQN